jgi:glucokinase
VSGLAVGVDVGGTFAKIALVTPAGEIVRSTSIPTGPRRSPAEFVRHVASALKGWKYDSLGLGLAGGLDAETGTLLFAPNLKRWIGFSFKREFERRLKVRTAADNDANVAVWGGYVAGLKKKGRTVVGVTLGTGVGGGLVVGGRLHRGATGGAGEIGHQIISINGLRCRCGRRGCLEAYAGTYGLQRLARRLMTRPPSPLTPKALADAARAGAPGARRVWREAGTYLGVGLANAVMLLNPDAIILLGGVARAGDLLLEPISRVFAAQPFREPFDAVKLSMPEDREWGCVGAALLSRERR